MMLLLDGYQRGIYYSTAGTFLFDANKYFRGYYSKEGENRSRIEMYLKVIKR